MTWQELYNLNKSTIGSDPSKIKVGQVLKLPGGGTYTVKSGDSLSKIAPTISSGSSKPAPKAKDPIQDMAEQVTKSVKKITPFEQVYGSLEKYLKAQKPLAEQGVAQQTNKYFLPQIDEGIANVRSELANRGLFRSGLRGQSETKFLTNIADEEETMRQQLSAQRELELRNRYGTEQKIYEKASETGAKYKPGVADWNKPIVVNPTFQPSAGFTGDRYSPVSTYAGQGTSKFGPAYQKWFEEKFKKTRPDISYNI